MATDKWCKLLLKEPYFSYICSDAFDVDSQLFKDYGKYVVSAINFGYIIAAMDSDKQTNALESLKGHPEYEVASGFLNLCHFKPVEFPKYCISDNYDHMTVEELGINIMYPFCSRMGGCFEKEFTKSGRLKNCLLLLALRLQN